MTRMMMFVYNYLKTDARVQRSALAISKIQGLEVDLIALKDDYNNSDFNILKLDIRTVSSLKRYLKFVGCVVKQGLKDDYDIIYAHDLYTALPALLLMSLRRNKKYVYDAHETIFPQKGVSFSLRDYFFYFFEFFFVKTAHLIITPQKDRSEIMKEHYKLLQLPMTVQNISVLEMTYPLLADSVSKKFREFLQKGGKTIVYAGGLNYDRQLELLIEAAWILRDRCKVILIGSGNSVTELRNIVKTKKIDNCLFVDTVPYKNLAELLEVCDVGYLSYPMTDINNIFCASNKVFEYASVFLPMVASYNKTINEIFTKWQIGECSGDLLSAITKVLDNIDYYKGNMQEFNKNHSWENEAEKLRETIKSLYIPHDELGK